MEKKSLFRFLLIAAVAVLIMFAFGLLRDYVFTNLNKEIPGNANGRVKIQPFTGNKIMILKWVLTGGFTIIYFGISFLIVKILFGKKNFLVITTVIFSSLFIFSFVVSIIGYLIGKQEIYYRISRDIMGLVQSPFLLMVLIPAFYLVKESDEENKISGTFDVPDEERKK